MKKNNLRYVKHLFMLTWLFALGSPAQAEDAEIRIVNHRPETFVNLQQQIPEIQLDMRYYTAHNFVGQPIDGYQKPLCLLTTATVSALKQVEERLLAMGLTLKVYDCYRPVRAVDNFVEWAESQSATKMRGEFYAAVAKKDLFRLGYIAAQSGHSRGSTLDLTIVAKGSKIPVINSAQAQPDCRLPQIQRSADNSLDFGSGFDCFSPLSHPDYPHLPAQAKANRLLLKVLMEDAGFKSLATEWWHFSLKNEPYPETFFDFPITKLD